MEILFYVGMIIFGFYCLVNEDINDVRRDFGLEEIDNGQFDFIIYFCWNDLWNIFVLGRYKI